MEGEVREDWKSRRENIVWLQSLHSRMSRETVSLGGGFSVADRRTLAVIEYQQLEKGENSWLKKAGDRRHTGRHIQADNNRTSRDRIATNDLPTSPAVVTTECILGEILLAVWTPRDFSILLPRHDTLFQSLPRVTLAPIQ
jgi:hypothetical protein